jgi:hypothetical protein
VPPSREIEVCVPLGDVTTARSLGHQVLDGVLLRRAVGTPSAVALQKVCIEAVTAAPLYQVRLRADRDGAQPPRAGSASRHAAHAT